MVPFRIYAKIDTGAIAHNIKIIKNKIGESRLMVIVKADGYGHGAARVASLLQNEADYFAVAELGEALEALIAKIVENHGDDVSIILARGMMEQTLENDYPNADTDEEIAAAKAAMELYHTSVTYMTDLIENRWKGQYEGHKILVAHLTPDRTGYEGHPTREGAAKQGKDLAEFIITKFADLVSQD